VDGAVGNVFASLCRDMIEKCLRNDSEIIQSYTLKIRKILEMRLKSAREMIQSNISVQFMFREVL
jgi:hypothetical protein